MIWPIALLVGILVALSATISLDQRQRRRRGRVLYELARQSKMNYSPLDRFDLAGRLRRIPAWATDTSDLQVRDVLYAAHGNERRFVATAIRRHTRDARPTVFVVACVERLSDDAFCEVTPRLLIEQSQVAGPYRKAIGLFE